MDQLFKTKKQKTVWIIWIVIVIFITGSGDVQLQNPILVGVQALTSLVVALIVAALFMRHDK